MNTKPTTLLTVNGSLNRKADNINTRTKERLINGEAKLRSNLVITATQKRDAINADKNPDKRKGSNINFIKKYALSEIELGIVSHKDALHFIIS